MSLGTPRRSFQKATEAIGGYFSQSRLNVWLRLLAVVGAYLDRGRFVYRPGLHCGMCDCAGGPCREWG
jgi:hypothetical protein